MKLSDDDLQAVLARNKHVRIDEGTPDQFIDQAHEADPGLESNLSKKIKAYCKSNGWPALVLPQHPALRRVIPKGWPDCVLVVPKRVIFIELKSATGDLREGQRLMAGMFWHLGHEIHKIRSFKKFVEVLYQ